MADSYESTNGASGSGAVCNPLPNIRNEADDSSNPNIDNWFPEKVVNWIRLHSTRLGVPDTYLALPLLVSIAYLSQRSCSTYRMKVEIDEADNDDNIVIDEEGKRYVTIEFHSEPLILYGVICGESGSNKSAALNIFSRMVEAIPNNNGPDIEHTLDTFSLDGLMTAMMRNNQCMLGLYDEMATFDDALDKGSSKSFDRSRFLTLFGAGKWKKNTKTSGNCILNDPRFNMVSFTQPYYISEVAENNKQNGFFARLLVSNPDERFVTMNMKKQLIKTNAQQINMKKVLESIYQRCVEKGIEVILDKDAEVLYDNLHDEIVSYRKQHKGYKFEKSIKSKSLGMVLRVSGVMSILRNAIDGTTDTVITGDDMDRALNVVQHCQLNSLSIAEGKSAASSSIQQNAKQIIRSTRDKIPMPAPENFDMDYLLSVNPQKTRNILNVPEIKLRKISQNKMYPSVPDDDLREGSMIARNFVQGLVVLGLGEVDKTTKSFRRFNPDDPDCHNPDELREMWGKLNM